MLSIFDSVSTLNPNAAEWKPRSPSPPSSALPTSSSFAIAHDPQHYMITDAQEQQQIDHAMHVFHHFASVNDSETLAAANAWLGTDPNGWPAGHAEYINADECDETTGMYLDVQDSLMTNAYVPPQRPKGNTASRARGRGKGRSSREYY